MRPEEK